MFAIAAQRLRSKGSRTKHGRRTEGDRRRQKVTEADGRRQKETEGDRRRQKRQKATEGDGRRRKETQGDTRRQKETKGDRRRQKPSLFCLLLFSFVFFCLVVSLSTRKFLCFHLKSIVIAMLIRILAHNTIL